MKNRRIPTSKVAITHNEVEGDAIYEGLSLLNIDKEIFKDDVVVITCNWVSAKPPETADVVGNIALDFIIKYFKKLNVKRIVVAAGAGGGNTLEVMKKVGYDKVLDENKVDFVDLNKGPFIEVKLNHDKPSSTKLNEIINDMTFHVSFTQLKIHEEATISACIKNMALSWPPTEEHGAPKKDTGIHEDLHSFIFEMAKHIPIDLSILSASPAMIGTGPHNGKSIHSNLVICGSDPVSVDTVGARFLGFKPQAVHYLYRLNKRNIGTSDINKINIIGVDLKKAEEIFSEYAYSKKEYIVDKK